MPKFTSAILLVLSLVTVQFLNQGCAATEKKPVKLNQLRVIGSHNSYKKAIEPALLEVLKRRDSASMASLQYEHIPIGEQLDLGLRNLEVDVYHDPQGGKYTNPMGISMLNEQGVQTLPYDTLNQLTLPGFKVFHVQDIDFRSHHLLFSEFLSQLRRWSKQNENHLPVFVTLEVKAGKIPGMTEPHPTTTATMDSVNLFLEKYLGADKLITPDWVRGEAKTLNEQVTHNGWPTLDESRGKFAFILDGKGLNRDLYMKNHQGLEGATMFISADPDTPEAAFMVINNPVKNGELIKEMVEKGYMIRTRADSGTKEARTSDYSRFEAAKNSGAQIITTDYYLPSRLFDSNYQVSFENNRYSILPE